MINHVVLCLGPRMAGSIAGLIKTLNEKYKDLCDKEADYLAASDTRCDPCYSMFIHFNRLINLFWDWAHD